MNETVNLWKLLYCCSRISRFSSSDW